MEKRRARGRGKIGGFVSKNRKKKREGKMGTREAKGWGGDKLAVFRRQASARGVCECVCVRGCTCAPCIRVTARLRAGGFVSMRSCA
eukprot:6198912-Pleurochrysis_carterae.AAC.2